MDKQIKEFFENQIKNWELAKSNFEALNFINKRPFQCGSLTGFVQFNPGRAISTLAKVDKNSIKSRKCFLCEKNRPKEQRTMEILPGWDLLVNPFPILPYHFTITNQHHIPQKLQLETGKELAGKLQGLTVFFNDEGAGASAPDHMHFQAVPLEELPLINLIDSDKTNSMTEKLLFKILTEEKDIKECKDPMNVYFWHSKRGGEIKFIAIPRKRQRPKEYFLQPPLRRAISPGAIDMAGILVTPHEEDFNLTEEKEIENIYRQVAFEK